MTQEVLAEQLAYYRARAPEYDSSVSGRSLSGPLLEALELVRATGPHRRVLEPTCGTGIWTAHLAEVAAQVVAVDAAPEMLAPLGMTATFQLRDHSFFMLDASRD